MIPGGPTENLEAQRMSTEDKKSEIFGIVYQYVAMKVAPTFKFVLTLEASIHLSS